MSYIVLLKQPSYIIPIFTKNYRSQTCHKAFETLIACKIYKLFKETRSFSVNIRHCLQASRKHNIGKLVATSPQAEWLRVMLQC